MKRLITSVILSAVTISGIITDNAPLDYETLSKADQLQIKKQAQYISYGIGKDANTITIHRHDEESRNLSASERYDVTESNGNFKEGQRYKVVYNGDFVTDIQAVK